jgi:hypothetical protein
LFLLTLSYVTSSFSKLLFFIHNMSTFIFLTLKNLMTLKCGEKYYIITVVTSMFHDLNITKLFWYILFYYDQIFVCVARA